MQNGIDGCRVTASSRREMKRRAPVEPVIGHVKAEHRMDRNYLKGRVGDRINAVLAFLASVACV
jgi:IS5 family transposase